MSKKLTVLAAAHALESFTVATLCSKAGVRASTVHTVLNRSPENWFHKTQLHSGTRGGQPVQYSLSKVGRQAIHQVLKAVSALPSLVPDHPTPDEPLGLTLARASLEKLAMAPPEAIEGLVEDALGNLQWAEAEVQEGAYSEPSLKMLDEIVELHRRLSTFATKSQTSVNITPRFPEWRPRGDLVEPPDSVGINTARSLNASAHPMGQLRAHKVLINCINNDVDSRVLAAFARGALASAHHVAGVRLDVVVSHLMTDLLFAKANQLFSEMHSSSAELVLCVNSAVNPAEVRTALQTMSRSNIFRSAVVLDHGSNAAVQQLAELCHISYEPNAAASSEVNWVANTMNGFDHL